MGAVTLNPNFMRSFDAGVEQLIAQARGFDEDAYRRCRIIQRNGQVGRDGLDRDMADALSIINGLGLSSRVEVAVRRLYDALAEPPGVVIDGRYPAQTIGRRAVFGMTLARLQSPDINAKLVNRLRNPWAIAATGAPLNGHN